MLVYTFLKKTAFFWKYKRQREIVIEEEQDCPREQEENGIWDVLGFYDRKNKTVYICEPKICKISREISEKLIILGVKKDTLKNFEDLLKSFEERMRREREELICEIVAAVV